MDRHSTPIHIPDHPLSEFGFTTFGKSIWDVCFSSDDELGIFSWCFGFVYLFFFLLLTLRLSYILKLYGLVFEYPSDDRRWLTREIPELEEDIFFTFGIEHLIIDMFENRKIFVESFSEVLEEVRIEDEFPFFDELVSIGSIDLRFDTLLRSCSLDE